MKPLVTYIDFDVLQDSGSAKVRLGDYIIEVRIPRYKYYAGVWVAKAGTDEPAQQVEVHQGGHFVYRDNLVTITGSDDLSRHAIEVRLAPHAVSRIATSSQCDNAVLLLLAT